MKKISASACLAIIILAICSASALIPSPYQDMSRKSDLVKAGSFTLSPAYSINIGFIDTENAASGNFMPVNLSVNVTRSSGISNAADAICGLGMFDFKIDTLQVPSGGKDARLMMVSPTHVNFMYGPQPCGYWISIIPTTDYLNSGSPQKPSPAKQDIWANGVYTLRLKYIADGRDAAVKDFSFTIGGPSMDASGFNVIAEPGQTFSPGHRDPIDQLNPQPEPPLPPVARGQMLSLSHR